MISKLGVIDQNNYDMVLKEYKEKFGYGATEIVLK